MHTRSHKPAALPSIALILVFIVSACGPDAPTAEPLDPAVIGTAVSGTVEAAGYAATIQSQAAQLTAQSANFEATSLALTATAELNNSSTTGTPQAPGTVPGTPPAAGDPTIRVSVDTNCRQGPNTTFAIISLLTVGATSTVRGKDTSGLWYYIADPKGGGGFCWLWNEFATIEGNTAAIQVVEAPTLPTAAPVTPATPSTGEALMSATFTNIHSCGGDVATLLIENSGGLTFQSARVTVRDPAAGEVLGQFSSDTAFISSATGCPPGRSRLAPGESAYVISPIDRTLASGAGGRIIVTACTETGLNGDCSEVRVDFQFP